MLFNSFEFLIFFPLVFVAYWLLNNNLKKQNILLLICSYVFYAWWDWRFLSLIIVSSLIDFTAGLQIFKAQTQRLRKRWLMVSLVANLGMLCMFKYYNFFAESFSDLMHAFGWQPNDLTLNIILPVGISFYTFQTLSYSIDIYRKEFKPTKDWVSFFTYIAFFPQLVAGPIERASNLLPQMEKRRAFKKEWFNAGVIQILVGLFRKIVIADTIGTYVDLVYGDVSLYNTTTIIIATFFYAFQIYYDFSGYSDIAIGTAKLLGFKFYQNFNIPYFSKSLTEFWRKWHMSLSYWLRDYLYIALGGSRKRIRITYRNLMLTMLLGGLWHGSSWNFIIWGGIHGTVLSLEKYLKTTGIINKFKRFGFLGYPITFIIVLFSWVFFRAQDLQSAGLAIKKIFQLDLSMPYIGDLNVMASSVFVLTIGVLFDLYLFNKKIDLEDFGANFSGVKMAVIATVIITLINLFYSSSNNFIYFQF
ncbi:MBOAT family protein [Formosa sp. L2A11]|uniref:MBOAT family O-acyltransferase n=1 Tax=Formosa sp. L2A11 TaxID=2686363 RepID=UPI00131E6233|nr:MBOAT family O-acyltransferase [Formosa sp. L2A11]